MPRTERGAGVSQAYSAVDLFSASDDPGEATGAGRKREGGMEDLGRRLKEVRIRAGLTLRELARQADVSPSLISQIENGKSQPSVATLYTFSRLLKVSVDDLFEDGSDAGGTGGNDPRYSTDPINAWQPSEYANRISVVHPSHRPQLIMDEGVVWERLAATPEHGVNFMKVCYAPGAASGDGDVITHEGYEYGYVLSGELSVTVGDEVFHLRPGESLGFDSSIPHVLRNLGEEPFEGIWFVHGSKH
jgi:transcriptional regulator with XRE-family HTH domain/quercetin dioxygenase-like cupin family protein